MGVQNTFQTFFDLNFQNTLRNSRHSEAPSGKVGPPFKLTFFWTEYCVCSRCIIQKWLEECNWNWTKSICQITRNHKQPYKTQKRRNIPGEIPTCSLTHTRLAPSLSFIVISIHYSVHYMT
jgi:hypothetical protein